MPSPACETDLTVPSGPENDAGVDPQGIARSRLVREVLEGWLSTRLDDSAKEWLTTQSAKVASGDRRTLFLAFGLVPRKTGKGDLRLNADELAEASRARAGWHPHNWSVDQAARSLLVLTWPHERAEDLTSVLDPLFNAGEVRELVALFSALPLYPFPEAHRARCEEGIRTNIRAVLLAITYDNPYPAEVLGDNSWNQLVLKALFNDVSLSGLHGVDDRHNASLVEMLLDFAEERHAAGRLVPLDLWRPIGPCLTDRARQKLEVLLTTGEAYQQKAAYLALRGVGGDDAKTLRSRFPELEQQVESGVVTWEKLVPRST
jgi:hypothetical protein